MLTLLTHSLTLIPIQRNSCIISSASAVTIVIMLISSGSTVDLSQSQFQKHQFEVETGREEAQFFEMVTVL